MDGVDPFQHGLERMKEAKLTDCPNASNPYHECTLYCEERYGPADAAVQGPAAGPGNAPLMDDVESVDIFRAVKLGWMERVQELVEAPDGKKLLHEISRFDDGGTVLHWAALFGRPAILAYLIKLGAPVDERTKSGANATPMHYASAKGELECIHVLLSNGADINAEEGALRQTPLMKAVLYKEADCAAFLIGKGAKLDAHDANGDTALHIGIKDATRPIVKLLIGVGAGLDVTNDEGQTPLHVAVAENKRGIVSTLVKEGADIKAADKHGVTPPELAKRLGKRLLFEYFQKLGQKSLWVLKPVQDENNNTHLVFTFFLVSTIFSYYIHYNTVYPFAQYPLHHQLFALMEAAMWVAILMVMYGDPGRYKGSKEEYDHEIRRFSELSSFKSGFGHSPLRKLCHSCRHVRPIRTQHCSVCNQCTQGFHVHTMLFISCVGVRNRRKFCFAVTWLAIGRALVFFWGYQELMRSEDLELGVGFMCIAVGAVGTYAMFCAQAEVYCIIQALTLSEFAHKATTYYLTDEDGDFHNPFSRGAVLNLLVFLGLASPKSLPRKHFV